ncbi:MAG TPA: hypothetical protein VFU39_07485, partial [Sulfuricaulis sp.]|nr:hypothetical protein [Sulfuricaulis sp.]
LLLLGEPEAVTAVAGAPGLSDELARRTWWAMPTSDIARRLLEKQAVVQGKMGEELAQFLVEHLPFESDSMLVIATIRLVLQPGLIEAPARERIFRLGTHRNVYHIGFLDAVPDALPDPLPARSDAAKYRGRLANISVKYPLAAFLSKLLDSPGQTFLAVSEMQLRHPVDKYTVATLMDIIGNYFKPGLSGNKQANEFGKAFAMAEARLLDPGEELAVLLKSVPELKKEIMAMLTLAHTGEALVTPIIAASTASGTLLRRKLGPVLDPLLEQYATLRQTAHKPPGGRSTRRVSGK